MGESEKVYLLDQRTARKRECGNKTDPVWKASNERKLKEGERHESWRKMKEQQFTETEVGNNMEVGQDLSEDEVTKSDTEYTMDEEEDPTSTHKKKRIRINGLVVCLVPVQLFYTLKII